MTQDILVASLSIALDLMTFIMSAVTWYPLPTNFQLYSCDTCGRQYRSKISLQRHKRLECGKEAQFSCVLCHARFKHKHSLLRHYNVHIADMKIANTFENEDRPV
ncbi:Longitudinals lacking protein, isoforms A/B/D/L [Harpegnathos saltator]|uniref:Longitudinals lacking protein, isoforms A/B/D/L n=1 Tax=Harpegnathos saltator TaxID=610380 RepID=E2BJC4_HARSA|nr:Longitudinals lacking protein, isoforms A/B/D/L [Harpegnathos saltator]